MIASASECTVLAATPAAALMVNMTPPATRRDGWVYEQGRLAEPDARAPGSVAAAAPASTSTIGYY
jgi:hypothetical protein